MILFLLASMASANRNLQISDIKIGEPATNATQSLKSNGWVQVFDLVDKPDSCNFEEQVKQGHNPSAADCYGSTHRAYNFKKSGQWIRIGLRHTRQGSVVSEAEYSTSDATYALSDVLKALTDKYGKPGISNRKFAYFCQKDSVLECKSGDGKMHQDRIVVSYNNGSTMVDLQPSQNTIDAWDLELYRAIRDKQMANGKPSL